MKVKKIYGWMIGISLLLLTLIGIQVLWLKRAAATQQRETTISIIKALANVQRELEKSVNCLEGYTKTFVDTADQFYMVHQRMNNEGRILGTDTLTVVYDLSGYKADTIVSEKIVKFRDPVAMEMKLSFHFPLNDAQSHLLQQDEQPDFSSARTYRDVLTNKLGITTLLNMDYADTLLRKILPRELLDTGRFGFGLIGENNNTIAFTRRINDTAALLRSPYTVSLFSDNKFITPYRLALFIPSARGNYVFDWWLWISIGIILLLTTAFYFFVRLYLQQTRLSEMKTDFINNLTHEFNTPMANISLAIETLSDNGVMANPKVNHILNIISSESLRLRENIERALQVATLEKGNLHLQKEEIDLVPMITTVVSGYQLQCEQLGGTISFTHPAKSIVKGDEVHLLNCVCNLLDNAIKYRRTVPVIAITLEEKAGNVLLHVTDNGIGMSNETQQHIFEKFYRAHQGNRHNTKGFGLGLNYVKGIITVHCGKISVWSKPGTGTKFTIQLPGVHDTVN